jgi:glycerophosphoryl diester phosphodiesterase
MFEKSQHKLVLHRGFSRWSLDDHTRPVQNTRKAFLGAADMGVAFAECDVWSTLDGKVITWHDSSIGAGAANKHDDLATTPIEKCLWDDLKQLKLRDGSNPALLETVLCDLSESGDTKLVIELKNSRPAVHVAEMLRNAGGPVVASAAWLMSFSLDALKIFKTASEGTQVPVVWLLDNSDYEETMKEEGETTFRYEFETLSQLLDRTGTRELFRELKCGLYLQYRPKLTLERLASLKEELAAEVPDGNNFIGLWTDEKDASFDKVDTMCDWVDVADAINTDLRNSFFES